MGLQSEKKKAVGFYDLSEILQYIPNFVTFLRIVALPHLVYAFNHQITLVSYVLFILAIGTDLIDGFIARKINFNSTLGAYLDVIFDFLFIFGMYFNFIVKGIYPPWILIMIIFVFSQFIFSNMYLKKTIYDPIGKYYGSLLFGGIGLTLLFTYSLIYQIVTLGIIISTAASIISRLKCLLGQRKRKNNSNFHT
jgi:phosphatidylglycerophosphate synthase